MITRYQNAVEPGPGNGKKAEEKVKDESCRCKETSALSPRELLKLMIRDLAIWKKERKKNKA